MYTMASLEMGVDAGPAFSMSPLPVFGESAPHEAEPATRDGS